MKYKTDTIIVLKTMEVENGGENMVKEDYVIVELPESEASQLQAQQMLSRAAVRVCRHLNLKLIAQANNDGSAIALQGATDTIFVGKEKGRVLSLCRS